MSTNDALEKNGDAFEHDDDDSCEKVAKKATANENASLSIAEIIQTRSRRAVVILFTDILFIKCFLFSIYSKSEIRICNMD